MCRDSAQNTLHTKAAVDAGALDAEANAEVDADPDRRWLANGRVNV